ncbi:MAG: type I glutamate--ammonia ligase [Chloroflexi bacterium]|nr:type I glutamate--ammonia ligase [Chloroflexota bacterium]MBV9547432.1 type I glutamate--ammonia ligase [Chloroflexota bacterium]
MTVDKAALKQRVFEQAEAAKVRFVSLQFTDIMGVVKNVHIPYHKFGDAVDHGLWFDGSSVEGFARIHESDMFLDPDLETFGVIPWERAGESATAKVICDVYTPDGEPFPGDPRGVLRCQLKRAEEMGFRYKTGPELEFFMLRRRNGEVALGEAGVPSVEPLPHDQAGYFDLTTDEAADVRKQMVEALEELGIVVEASHHEVAIGQHEIDFKYDDAMRTADNAVTFRTTLKAIAQQHGLYATFMPKPFHGINGNGMHCHQSLWSVDGSTNQFFDAADEYQLSQTARSFMAGLLAHARGMIAVLAPLVNSYKRLVPGYEAPVYISWARINRSALIRIPQASRGRPEATRLELRCPDPSCNPYLAFAVMLAAGLDGIERGLELSRPVEENLYHFDDTMIRKQGVRTLPGSLEEALDELARDEVVQGALGAHVSEWFLEAKRAEWNEYRTQVTPWELERYLMTY